MGMGPPGPKGRNKKRFPPNLAKRNFGPQALGQEAPFRGKFQIPLISVLALNAQPVPGSGV